jgi:hypothetical protein
MPFRPKSRSLIAGSATTGRPQANRCLAGQPQASRRQAGQRQGTTPWRPPNYFTRTCTVALAAEVAPFALTG